MAKRKRKNFDLDPAIFNQKIKRLLVAVGREQSDFVREQAGLYCIDLSRNTPPFDKLRVKGNTYGPVKAIRTVGEKAVVDDLRNCFSVLEDRFVDWIADQFGTGRIDQVLTSKRTGQAYRVRCDSVARNLSDLRHFHQERQNSRTGRVPAPNAHSNYDNPERMLVGETLFAQYMQDQLKNVGIARAAFAKCARALGNTRRVPSYISRHLSKVSATAVMISGKHGAVAKMSGRAAGLQHTLKFVPMIIRHRQKRMRLALENHLKKIKQASGFK